ncbi:MAG TPA: SpoIIE family protein phosphatase [Candidatus Dorea gallistercoris]|uniref:SpoIIE family protein phosphatase n=1 Tax=Candidatus Dorea gallistercoris TaxID=2838542 RepID=A0A9D1R8P7_9FIRM|nr:SpoIIE family protein phosphatase [Candidatus Dorea gallistercoris]
MAEISEKEKTVFLNPYVIQMDKFADSLIHLSRTFLSLESYKGTFSREEFEEMFTKITDKVCEECEKKEQCLQENRVYTYQMMYEILCGVEEYGAELNVELKRKLQKRCIRAPRFLRETLEVFENAKQVLMWNNKIVQNREGYAGQLNSFAKLIQYTTRELDAGIFEDEHLEKKLKTHLKKSGIKLLSSVFFVTEQGKYEIHLTAKASKGQCVATKDLAHEVGACIGRSMVPQQGERPILGEEYCTVACVEGARFYTLQGVAKIGKNCEKISGDTFLMTDLPGGKKGAALSDGMGSGEDACRESTMVVEMLEELLEAGFPVKTAIQIMNTALVIGRDDVRFSTIDVSLFDLYSGSCEFVKAGASATFIKRKDQVERITSTTLPIGVIQEIEIDVEQRELESGDFVVMVTDGVMDALPAGEQDTLMETFIREASINNPKELAHHLLGRVLEWTGELPLDDMTILVIGIWKR